VEFDAFDGFKAKVAPLYILIYIIYIYNIRVPEYVLLRGVLIRVLIGVLEYGLLRGVLFILIPGSLMIMVFLMDMSYLSLELL